MAEFSKFKLLFAITKYQNLFFQKVGKKSDWSKLRKLVYTNGIVYDSDFNPSKFERCNLSDSKSHDEFGLQLKDN